MDWPRLSLAAFDKNYGLYWKVQIKTERNKNFSFSAAKMVRTDKRGGRQITSVIRQQNSGHWPVPALGRTHLQQEPRRSILILIGKQLKKVSHTPFVLFSEAELLRVFKQVIYTQPL